MYEGLFCEIKLWNVLVKVIPSKKRLMESLKLKNGSKSVQISESDYNKAQNSETFFYFNIF